SDTPSKHKGQEDKIFNLKTLKLCEMDVNRFLKSMRRPGIEPGSQEWESCIIPLHQQRFFFALLFTMGKDDCSC
ncbi:hypothetical protein CHS0354_032909, partial [Potamilus streckersoni]